MRRASPCRPAGVSDDALVFPSRDGTPLKVSNLGSRVLKPAAVRAGLGEWEQRESRKGKVAVSWVGFHTLRHTCGTLLFRAGYNAKQVQHWLGHHSPAFTLATYVHLLPDDLPAPDDAFAFLASNGQPSSRDLEGRATTGQPDVQIQAETDAALPSLSLPDLQAVSS
jgi:integrase